jgi:integrase
VLRIAKGKGQKDRYVMLSPKLLAVLRAWWQVDRPRHWLFPGERPEKPITPDAVRYACQLAARRARLTKPVSPHALRNAST